MTKNESPKSEQQTSSPRAPVAKKTKIVLKDLENVAGGVAGDDGGTQRTSWTDGCN